MFEATGFDRQGIIVWSKGRQSVRIAYQIYEANPAKDFPAAIHFDNLALTEAIRLATPTYDRMDAARKLALVADFMKPLIARFGVDYVGASFHRLAEWL